MNKIVNYIKKGKGLGFLFLMAAATVMTIFIMLACKQVYSQMYPQIMLAADEILPITILNGKIVSPDNVYKRVDISLGEINGKKEIFPIVLDTQSEDTSLPKAEMGLFLMKDVLYLRMEDEIKRVSLQDGEFDKSLLNDKLEHFLGSVSVVVAAMMVLLFFVMSLIKALILALIGSVMLKVKKREGLFGFDALMRLSAIVVALVEVLGFLLSLSGIPIFWFYQFIAAFLFVAWFIYKEMQIN